MILVVSSDWHGDAITDGVPRSPEIEQAVEEVVGTTLELDADHPGEVVFVFAGDLTDPHSNRSHHAVAIAVAAASTLKSNEIHSLWMTGNHDVFEDGSGDHTLMALEDMGSEVSVYSRPMFYDQNGVRILLLPFTPTSHAYDPDEVVRSFSKATVPDIVIGHLNLDDITPGSESVEYARGRSVFWPLDALQEVCPNAVLIGGHYHSRQIYEGVQIIGAPVRFTHGEATHEPGFLVVEVD